MRNDKLPLLNVGCGVRRHPAWTNLDLSSASPEILAHDLRRGLPFPDGTFELVYHSHVLEHLPRAAALPFLRECIRVLKPGGLVRVAVPDLERVAALYLEQLRGAATGEPGAGERYDWMMLELYDQSVRERSEGEMAGFVRTASPELRRFVRERFGAEAARLEQPPAPASPPGFLHRARRTLARLLLGGRLFGALQEGRFRQSGEIHRWMYDRFSLARLLTEAGFRNPRQRSAEDSARPGWKDFHLDTEPDGTVAKPDSLFMEAARP